MIITETFYIGEQQFTRTYSNSGRYVVRDGVEYNEACDPTELGRQYTEGELMQEEEQLAMAEDILNILLGGDSA